MVHYLQAFLFITEIFFKYKCKEIVTENAKKKIFTMFLLGTFLSQKYSLNLSAKKLRLKMQKKKQLQCFS